MVDFIFARDTVVIDFIYNYIFKLILIYLQVHCSVNDNMDLYIEKDVYVPQGLLMPGQQYEAKVTSLDKASGANLYVKLESGLSCRGKKLL